MKTIQKTALATVATVFALTAAIAEANPLGYGSNKIKYADSFNSKTNTDIDIDNSKKFNSNFRLNYDVNNSRQTHIDKDTRLNYRYDIRKDDINAKQRMNQFRAYSSGVGQSAGNVGSARGHSMQQNQGGTSVGALVSETSNRSHKGHNLLSPGYSSAYGNVAKGNMSGSQIGAMQSGMQMGNVINAQNNSQDQVGGSSVNSTDRVSNTATK